MTNIIVCFTFTPLSPGSPGSPCRVDVMKTSKYSAVKDQISESELKYWPSVQQVLVLQTALTHPWCRRLPSNPEKKSRFNHMILGLMR